MNFFLRLSVFRTRLFVLAVIVVTVSPSLPKLAAFRVIFLRR